jgi:hypothetical protein
MALAVAANEIDQNASLNDSILSIDEEKLTEYIVQKSIKPTANGNLNRLLERTIIKNKIISHSLNETTTATATPVSSTFTISTVRTDIKKPKKSGRHHASVHSDAKQDATLLLDHHEQFAQLERVEKFIWNYKQESLLQTGRNSNRLHENAMLCEFLYKLLM